MNDHPDPAQAPAIADGLSAAIGNTPLIRLNSLSKETGCEILGKAEFMNPGGSVKDRTALGLILDAEQRGLLKPGATVVEGTAGNTGIGLATLCRARGYRLIIVIPETQSSEKLQLLRSLGAEVHAVPAAPYASDKNYQKIARRMAADIPGAVWADQFDNTANRRIHELTTAPEIWQQCHGRLDAFVAATGTGGTLAGVATWLKQQSKASMAVLADPSGSALFNYIKQGEPSSDGGGSITEGIGNSRVTANLNGAPIDDALRISDEAAVEMVFRLLNEEGLMLGSSSGINVAAAVALAKQLGPGKRIVTILCDHGQRYYSRLFNPDWLAEKGLLEAARHGGFADKR